MQLSYVYLGRVEKNKQLPQKSNFDTTASARCLSKIEQ